MPCLRTNGCSRRLSLYWMSSRTPMLPRPCVKTKVRTCSISKITTMYGSLNDYLQFITYAPSLVDTGTNHRIVQLRSIPIYIRKLQRCRRLPLPLPSPLRRQQPQHLRPLGWGKLASDILTGQWDVDLEELNTLRDVIDSHSSSSLLTFAEPAALTQLHSRTWHVHWSLFVYFNHEQGRTLLETFLSPT